MGMELPGTFPGPSSAMLGPALSFLLLPRRNTFLISPFFSFLGAVEGVRPMAGTCRDCCCCCGCCCCRLGTGPLLATCTPAVPEHG